MTNPETNYEYVWGNTPKDWRAISFGEKHFINVLTVFAWVGMVGTFVSILFLLVTTANAWAIGMIFFMFLWLACGLAAIRIRRSKLATWDR